MNRNEIRRKTCIVIRRNGEYLRGKDMLTRELMWTGSIYDAWKTRDLEQAKEVARKLGGITVLFNPILRQKQII